MDTSKEYISMCKNSEEIQSMNDYAEDGDFYYIEYGSIKECVPCDIKIFDSLKHPVYNFCTYCGLKLTKVVNEKGSICIYPDNLNTDYSVNCWLPRVDQLIELIDKVEDNIQIHRIKDVLNGWVITGSRYPNTLTQYPSTLEQALLKFYMQHVYVKFWDNKNNAWRRLASS